MTKDIHKAHCKAAIQERLAREKRNREAFSRALKAAMDSPSRPRGRKPWFGFTQQGNLLTRNPQDRLDPETCAKAKPNFEALWADWTASGKSLRDFVHFVVTNFESGVRPYVFAFMKEKQAEINTARGGASVPTAEASADAHRIDLYQDTNAEDTSDGVKSPYLHAMRDRVPKMFN